MRSGSVGRGNADAAHTLVRGARAGWCWRGAAAGGTQSHAWSWLAGARVCVVRCERSVLCGREAWGGATLTPRTRWCAVPGLVGVGMGDSEDACRTRGAGWRARVCRAV